MPKTKEMRVYHTGRLTQEEMVADLWLSPAEVADREGISLHEVRAALAEDRVFPVQKTGAGIRIAPVYVIAPRVAIVQAQRSTKPAKPVYRIIKALPDGRVRERTAARPVKHTGRSDASAPPGLPKRAVRKRPTVIIEAIGRPQGDDGQTD